MASESGTAAGAGRAGFGRQPLRQLKTAIKPKTDGNESAEIMSLAKKESEK